MMVGMGSMWLHRAVRHSPPSRRTALACFSVGRYQMWQEKREHRRQMLGRESLSRHSLHDPEESGSTRSLELRTATVEIRDLGLQRKWEEALALFRATEGPDSHLYTTMIAACARSSELSMAQRLFNEMPTKTVSAYNSIITLLGRMGHIHDVQDLLEQMGRQSLEPDAVCFRSVIVSHGMAHDAEGAVRVLRDMEARGLPLGEAEYSCALTACGRSGASERCFELLGEMDTRCVQAHIGHITSLITAHAKCKDEDGARKAFAELHRRGIQPDLVAYTSLICCFSGPDSLPKADALLAEVLQQGFVPQVYFFNEMLRLATESGDPQRFQQILHDMERRGIVHNAGTFNRIKTQQLRVQFRRPIQDGPYHQASAALPAAGAPGTDLNPRQASALPDGWCEAVDPASGNPYYWQAADPTNTTTWTRPLLASSVG